MSNDVIGQLGELAFASRLRRLSERLMQDVSRVYRDQDLDFEARWFTVGYLLFRNAPMSVTELADALGLTHPAVSQIAGLMEEHGLVESERDPADERRRLLSLSSKGQSTLRELEPIWEAVAECTNALLGSTAREFFGALTEIETRLSDDDMYDRVTRLLKERRRTAVEIVEYPPGYEMHFRQLNLEWLREDFEVEAHDRAILENPDASVVGAGGRLLFARVDGEIVGTVALLPHESGIHEIAKMAVTKAYRGRQVGRKLALAAIEIARSEGASEVVLATSPKLARAVELYRSLGFVETEPHPIWKGRYKRPTIFMRLDLKETS